MHIAKGIMHTLFIDRSIQYIQGPAGSCTAQHGVHSCTSSAMGASGQSCPLPIGCGGYALVLVSERLLMPVVSWIADCGWL